MLTQFKLCQNSVKIVLINFACYSNDTARFLAVLRNRLNHTRKFIRAKHTDDIKHDSRYTLHFRTVIMYEFFNTNTISNERISCLFDKILVPVVAEKQSSRSTRSFGLQSNIISAGCYIPIKPQDIRI